MISYPRVGIGVLVFNDRGEILLGKRIAGHGKFSYGPPGGHLEFGESFETCACREVKEETGLVITDPKFFAVTNDIFEEENRHYVSIFMRAAMPHGQEVRTLEPEKHLEWTWFEIDNLPESLFLPLKNLIRRDCAPMSFPRRRESR